MTQAQFQQFLQLWFDDTADAAARQAVALDFAEELGLPAAAAFFAAAAAYGWCFVDGCSAKDFEHVDVLYVVRFATTKRSDWDGNTAGVLRLCDGRFVAWEASWGPTGDGFNCDAYGGTADLVFAHTEAAAVARLTERGRGFLQEQGLPRKEG